MARPADDTPRPARARPVRPDPRDETLTHGAMPPEDQFVPVDGDEDEDGAGSGQRPARTGAKVSLWLALLVAAATGVAGAGVGGLVGHQVGRKTGGSGQAQAAGAASAPVTAADDADDELRRAAGDLDAYKTRMKTTTPLSPDDLIKKGLKAESYVKDDRYEFLKELVLRVSPVYLTDKLTGRTAKYTRVRLIRNNPAVYRANSGRMPETFEWAHVEMLP